MLDWIGVIEQSRSLSAEIVLEQLLTKLLTIVIEHAKATRGIIVLFKDDELRIEAIAQVGDHVHCVLQQSAIQDGCLLPVSIIHEVVKTRSSLVLENASCKGKFTTDPFMAQQPCLSILCIPIANYNSLVGVLYLENQAKDAFSLICLEALEILCAQAAISIENALLYQSLKQQVAECSHQLIEVNAALQASEAERQRLEAELQGQQTLLQQIIITDRKQAETAQQEQLHLLQVILDALPFPIFYKDDRGIYLGCNRSFLEYRGMSEAQIVGKSVYETAPAHMAEIYAKADQALFTSRGIQTYETVVAYADGSQHEVIFYKAAFLNRQGGLGGLVGAILDIDDRKRAEAALQASLEQLARANQEIKLLNHRLESENLRLSAELAVARQLQQIMLPKEQEFNQIEGLEISAFMKPADEVGGDYYDVLRHGDAIKIGIGDVTGHGLESGILMIMAQTAVRTLLLSNETNPQRFLNTINRVLYENIQRMNSDKNLSLSLLDYQAGRVKLSGQHEEMLVVRSDGQIERIDTIDLGFLLGIVPDISDFTTQIEVQLQPGDGVVLYTDGITEAENLTKEYYGVDRLCQLVSQSWQHSADEIRQVIIEDVQLHIGRQKIYDDMTLLVLKQH